MHQKSLFTVHFVYALFIVFCLVAVTTLPREAGLPVVSVVGLPYYNASDDYLWVRTGASPARAVTRPPSRPESEWLSAA